ncbi:MAG: AmpD protein [Paracoccaceae bacterium]|jgi:AmpD protein
MQIIDSKGWLTELERCPSPNYDERPQDADISLLVIHNISLPSGQFGGAHIQALFCNQLDCSSHLEFADLRGLRVSSHLLINRDGELCQFVSFLDRAWHAGVSECRGRSNCNDFSIGIELEGTDELPYTDRQYKSLGGVTKTLQTHYPQLANEGIVGHSDIAPGRKTDPGDAFDWRRYRKLLG